MTKKEKVFNKYDGRCSYCGDKISIHTFHSDHIDPKYYGGDNNIDNLNPSCPGCNTSKGNRTIEQWRESIYLHKHRVLGANSSIRTLFRLGVITVSEEPVVFFFERH